MTSRLPHLTCCPYGARFVTLRYAPELTDIEYASRDAFLQAARLNPPTWKILALDNEIQQQRAAPIAVCPFCGTHVPAIRLRSKPPKRVCVVIDGGYYCATCERRLIDCRCAPTERLWEMVHR